LTCLLLFIVYIGGMGVLTAYGLYRGGAERLLYGMDSFGNLCGMTNENHPGNHKYNGLDMTYRPNVFFFDFMAEIGENLDQTDATPGSRYSVEICVRECPTRLDSAADLIKQYNQGNNLCMLNYDQMERGFDSEKEIKKANTGKAGPCPNIPMGPTKTILNRCVPTSLGASANAVVDFVNNIPTVNKIVRDLYATRYTILYCSLVSVALSVLFVFMLRYLASIVVWIIIFGTIAISLLATGLMWYCYLIGSGQVTNQIDQLEELTATLSSHEDILWFSIGVSIFTLFMISFALAAISRAKLAAELFAQAGKVIGKIPLLLFQPFWMYFTLILIWSLWAMSVAFLASAGDVTYDAGGYVTINQTDLWWAYLIQAFGIIWVTEVVVACHQFMLSSAVSRYYFCMPKSEFSSTSPLLESFLTLITYHMGSICFGSLLVALLRIPQAICGYIYHKSKETNNKLAQCLAKACMCCLCLFEKCLRYFNATSYAMVAITGHSYCVSACKGAKTLASNAFRVGALAMVGGLTLFLGKCLVAICSGVCAGLMVRNFPDHPEVKSLTVPIFVCCILGYIISSGFFAVFSTAVNTLMLCFCEDCRVNDGTPEKPYFMPRGMMQFVATADHSIKSGKYETEENVPLRTMK